MRYKIMQLYYLFVLKWIAPNQLSDLAKTALVPVRCLESFDNYNMVLEFKWL